MMQDWSLLSSPVRASSRADPAEHSRNSEYSKSKLPHGLLSGKAALASDGASTTGGTMTWMGMDGTGAGE